MKPPILARAELEVMQTVWRLGAATVHDVVAALPRRVAYTTALTTLRILERKGYVKHEPDGAGSRAHRYRPAIAEAQARRSFVHDMVERLFGGSAEELAIGLVRDEELSRADLEALRAEIDLRLAPRARRTGAGKRKEGAR